MSQPAPLRMPKLGLTMTEGVLASWAVAVGDRVKAGAVLFTIETDKIATEIEAQGDGEILALEAQEGETYAVGAVLGQWTGPGVELDVTVDTSGSEPAPEAVTSAAVPNASEGERVLASPLARRLARNAGIDLAAITGSGAKGRIKARDVEAARVSAPVAVAVRQASPATTRTPAPAFRKIVARRMVEAKQAIPHFYVLANADLAQAGALRAQLNTGSHPKLSITHILIAALARAATEMPDANEVWEDETLVRYGSVDIGVAVATERGLLAPLARDLAGLTLDQVAARADAVIARARSGSLQQDDLVGGAISISNVGMFGAAGLIPIVNPGQSAILGVGAAERLFRPDANGQPRLCEELKLTLSCDHRVWDGARAARFLDRVRQLVEQPAALLRP